MKLDGAFCRRTAALQRMALSPRHPQSAPRGERGGPRPSALFDHAGDHGNGNPADPLHDRLRRRRHHPLRALRDLWHRRIVAPCGHGASGSLGLPAGPSRHDRGRAFAGKSDVAWRSRSRPWRGNITAAFRSARRRCCRKPRSKTFARGWPDMAPAAPRIDTTICGASNWFSKNPNSFHPNQGQIC